MKTINLIKGIIFYLTMVMGFLTIGIDFYNTPVMNLIVWFGILSSLGFCTYNFYKNSTEEEFRSFIGVTYIKNKFGIDLLSED